MPENKAIISIAFYDCCLTLWLHMYRNANDGFNHIFLVILTNNLLMIEAIGFLSIIVEIA